MRIQKIPVMTSLAQPSRPVCPPTPGQPRCADQATGNTTAITRFIFQYSQYTI